MTSEEYNQLKIGDLLYLPHRVEALGTVVSTWIGKENKPYVDLKFRSGTILTYAEYEFKDVEVRELYGIDIKDSVDELSIL